MTAMNEAAIAGVSVSAVVRALTPMTVMNEGTTSCRLWF